MYVLQGINYFLPLLVLPYLLRTLGPNTYGGISFAQSLMAYCAILSDFGFNFSATRAISIAREDKTEVAKIFWTTLCTKLALFAFITIFLCFSILSFPTLKSHAWVIGACSLSVLGSVIVPQWYFQGLERLKVLAFLQALSRISAIALVFVFVKSPTNQVAAAILLSIPQVIAGVLGITVVIKLDRLNLYRPTLPDIITALSNSFDLFISNAATSAYVVGNAFIIGILLTDKSVALYSVANKIALATFYLFLPVSLTIFPRASLLFSKSHKDANTFLRKVAPPFLIAAALASLALITFSREIVDLIGGVQYGSAIPLLRIMGILPLLLSAATILGQIIMINLKLEKSLRRIYSAMAIISLLTLPAFTKMWGDLGAAITLVVIEGIGPILMILKLRQVKFFASDS